MPMVAIMVHAIHAVAVTPVRPVADVIAPVGSIGAVAVCRVIGRRITVGISVRIAAIVGVTAIGGVTAVGRVATVIIGAGQRGADQGTCRERSDAKPEAAAVPTSVPAAPPHLYGAAVLHTWFRSRGKRS